MKHQINTPSSAERFVPAQYIREDGTIEVYSNYMVSDHGRVASMKGKVMKILKPRPCDKLGYLHVGLWINGKRHSKQSHRLVLSSFHPELWSRDTNEVDHIDRDVTNNHLDNLHWTDRNGNCTNRSIGPVKQIRVTHLSDNHTEIFDSMPECSRAFRKSTKWCNDIIRNRNGFNAKLNILIEKI